MMEIVKILLVEDDPGDIILTKETLEQMKLKLQLEIIDDGSKVIDFLKKKNEFQNAVTPDIILLDLNLPKKNGFEILNEIKSDHDLKAIPVIILTTSSADQDILKTYKIGCNCFITKPLGFDQFQVVVNAIENFWFTIVKLPN